MTPYYSDDLITIYHGDCREVTEWLEADVLVTDPPYGETSLEWDRWPDGWPAVAATGNARQFWCFGTTRMFLDFRDDFGDWKLAQEIVWEKTNGSGFATDRFRRVHELVTHWYRGTWGDLHHAVPRTPSPHGLNKSGRRRGSTPHTGAIGDQPYIDDGTRLMRSVIKANAPRTGNHPTEKPAEVVKPLVTYSCPRGGIVADPFMGSGTTVVAAKSLGRKAIGVELDERYCEIAAKRCAQEVLDFGGAA